MSISKEILYKKKDDETWYDWSNRFNYYDEHKRDYIYDTIYKHCKSDLLYRVEPLSTNKIKIALDITDIIINIDIQELICMLENTELLNKKITELYKIVRDAE